MEFDGVYVEEAGLVARVIMDRPPVNAVSTGMYESLIDVFAALDKRDDINVVTLESAHPKAFSAGADIQELREIVNSESPEPDIRRQRLARETYDALLNLSVPTVAAVGGVAYGAGAVLAACCDIRIGAESTRIALTEVNIVRCGGARHLSRILPQGVVRRMYFTAQPLTAEELYRHGAIDQICGQGGERETALAMAREIASKSPIALRVAKRALNAAEPLSVAEGYEIEQEYTLEVGRTDDAKEAAAAFLEKRAPVWTGR